MVYGRFFRVPVSKLPIVDAADDGGYGRGDLAHFGGERPLPQEGLLRRVPQEHSAMTHVTSVLCMCLGSAHNRTYNSTMRTW
jgi:hypothetical protein